MHKVANSLIEASGEKYKRAVAWKSAHIVSLDWLFASAKIGAMVDETQYPPSHNAMQVEPSNPQTTDSSRPTILYTNGDQDPDDAPIEASAPPRVLNPVHDPIFTGLVIFMSRRLPMTRQSDLENKISGLGGSYRYTFDKSITHFVYEGKQADAIKEEKILSNSKVKIVSPYWVDKCMEAGRRLPELDFPCTLNPKMSLGVSEATSYVAPVTTPVKRVRELSPDKSKKKRKSKGDDKETWDQALRRKEMKKSEKLSQGVFVSPTKAHSDERKHQLKQEAIDFVNKAKPKVS
jgi:hypothetical protein